MKSSSLALFACFCALSIACGSAAGGSGSNPNDEGGAGSGGESAGGAGGSTAGGAGGVGGGGAGGSGGFVAGGGSAGTTGQSECANIQKTAEVYAHSPDTLYRLDPVTKATTQVAKFGGCKDQVIDLAIDKSGQIFVTTFTSLERVDPVTAKCTVIATGSNGSFPNSLSFVPAGTINPTEETMVGYQTSAGGDAYVRIDTKSGKITSLPGGLPDGYASSGDIVSVIGGGTYLTVTGNGCDDCIVRVDPATGAMVENLGPVGYSNVFGLAFWGGEVYGFNDEGELFIYDLKTNQAKAVPIPNAPSGVSFYGAGSTTCARLTTQIN